MKNHEVKLVTLGHNYVFWKIILKIACMVSEKSDSLNPLINSKFSKDGPLLGENFGVDQRIQQCSKSDFSETKHVIFKILLQNT
jgi:hypothetical protein